MSSRQAEELAPARQAPIETPLEDRELVVLGVAVFALVYALLAWRSARREPSFRLLVLALVALVVGLVITNAESFFFGQRALAFNIVEHLAYLAHTFFLVAYLYKRRGASAS